MLKRVHLWAFLVACVPAALLAQAPTDRLTLDTYFDLETVNGPQFSPDASQVVYTRGWVDKVNDAR